MTPKEAFTLVILEAALNVDCEKIAASMAATGWHWFSVEGVPDAHEVRQSLFDMVRRLIVNFDEMHLEDGQTLAQPHSGGWHYIISHWHPMEYRVMIIHGHSGEADNIHE